MAVGALVVFPQIPKDGDRVASTLEMNTDTHPGALSISGEVPVVDVKPIPELTNLHRHRPDYTFLDCRQTGGEEPGSDEVTVCADPDAPQKPTARVVLAAGSHAGHWEATVRAVGRAYNWEVLVAIKSGCILQDHDNPDTTMCQSWNENFIDWVGTNDIDLVITSGTRVFSRGETIGNGAPTRWEQITDHDVDLLLLRGTPRPRDGGAKCLQAEQPIDECGVTAGDVALPNPLLDMDLPEGAQTIDLNPQVCPTLDQGEDAWCPAVVGNVYVWYDGSHLSREYAATLAPAFEQEMHKVLPQYF